MKPCDYRLYTTDGRAKAFNDITYSMSTVNNALYISDNSRKTIGLFNKDYIYGISDAVRVFESYDEAKKFYIDNNISCMFQVKFNNGDYIYIFANKFDYDAYTNMLTFSHIVSIEEKQSRMYPVGIFNMENLIGFQKITFEGGEDELRED